MFGVAEYKIVVVLIAKSMACMADSMAHNSQCLALTTIQTI